MRNFLTKITDERIKTGLVQAIWDGVLWAIMFGLAENYLVPFALIFGATIFQISLMQGLAQIGAGLAQLLGAPLILKFRKRKLLTIWCCRFHAFSWLLIFFITFWTKSPWSILLFYVGGLFIANIGGPGWVSWMNDIVPQQLRGEYWGIRNKIIGIAQFVFVVIGGVVLHIAEGANHEILAYGILFTIAFAVRFANFIPLSKQYEPPMSVPAFTNEFKFRIFLTKLATTNFGRFALFSILMTFAVNLLGPIQPIYLLQALKCNYLQFTILTMIPIITTFIAMTYWGRLGDLYGNYRILFVTGMAIPLLAINWTIFTNFSVLMLMQACGGFVFAGFNLATANFIFDAVRRENISKIMAYFNTLNTLCAFLGALTGGWLVDVMARYDLSAWRLNKFTFVFAISALLRIVVFSCFIRSFKEVRPVKTSPPLHFFYIYKPAMNVINQFQMFNDLFFRIGHFLNYQSEEDTPEFVYFLEGEQEIKDE